MRGLVLEELLGSCLTSEKMKAFMVLLLISVYFVWPMI